MKISNAKAKGFLDRLPGEVRCVLLHGPDQGLVRERADALASAAAGDAGDPFRVAHLVGPALWDDPARLLDEAAALSFTGGRRVVRVREATDAVAQAFATLLEDSRWEALVIAEAGEIGPASPLRRLCEKAEDAAAVGCYADGPEDLPDLIRDVLAERGLAVAADALDFLAEHLGADRAVTRGELEKLALYKGGAGSVELADAIACVGDSASFSLDDVVFAMGDGELAALDRALDRAALEGVPPVAVLRAAQRHLQRLHRAVGASAAGASPRAAMETLKPPVFYALSGRFLAQMRRWPAAAIGEALLLLTEAELDCKTTGLPAQAIAARALMRVAQVARARPLRGASAQPRTAPGGMR